MSSEAAATPDPVGQVLHDLGLGNYRPAILFDRRIPLPAREFTQLNLLALVGRAVRARAGGDVAEAWELLAEASVHLPLALRSRTADGRMRARLGSTPAGSTAGWGPDQRIAALIWREQFELDKLRQRVEGLTPGRPELVEAAVEHLCMIEYNPYAWFPEPADVADPPVDRTRAALLERASRLRQFADPTAGRVSQSVWQDLGQYRALCAAALDSLAERPAAAPWLTHPGCGDLPVHLGCLMAWQFACTRRRSRTTDHGVSRTAVR